MPVNKKCMKPQKMWGKLAKDGIDKGTRKEQENSPQIQKETLKQVAWSNKYVCMCMCIQIQQQIHVLKCTQSLKNK